MAFSLSKELRLVTWLSCLSFLPWSEAAATLTWKSCGTSLECASLTVPREYATGASSSATASIALIRYNATVPAAQRLGTLLTNPVSNFNIYPL